MQNEIITRTHLTCPVCGAREELEIPADMCLFFHTCATCSARFRPEAGDCCVFCSYGDASCIPQQREQLAAQSEENGA
ncbi:MAG: hypothetical protein KIS95_05120 [Anaerolineae bacterium]|uniref:GDCCVxC domain-containing (seleno)protein n=1 Tax=Promineifilum sp. TaxID=2664178 RepID=UPI001E0D2574|nr:hypothetical protein [Anaerolineales bacterium]MCB8935306.1 hypothetical protein [Promineifilum sp.]MCO5180368.1 hypothetical protein [Promineifilum sp.]MCW5846588.1 hypothetical protein [Anaerolineae bacterium]